MHLVQLLEWGWREGKSSVVPPDMIHRQAALSNEYRPEEIDTVSVSHSNQALSHICPRGRWLQLIGEHAARGWMWAGSTPNVAAVPSKGAGSTQGAITGHGQGTLCLSGSWFPSLPPHSHGAGFFYTGFTRFCLQPHSASCTKLNVQLLFAAS